MTRSVDPLASGSLEVAGEGIEGSAGDGDLGPEVGGEELVGSGDGDLWVEK